MGNNINALKEINYLDNINSVFDSKELDYTYKTTTLNLNRINKQTHSKEESKNLKKYLSEIPELPVKKLIIKNDFIDIFNDKRRLYSELKEINSIDYYTPYVVYQFINKNKSIDELYIDIAGLEYNQFYKSIIDWIVFESIESDSSDKSNNYDSFIANRMLVDRTVFIDEELGTRRTSCFQKATFLLDIRKDNTDNKDRTISSSSIYNNTNNITKLHIDYSESLKFPLDYSPKINYLFAKLSNNGKDYRNQNSNSNNRSNCLINQLRDLTITGNIKYNFPIIYKTISVLLANNKLTSLTLDNLKINDISLPIIEQGILNNTSLIIFKTSNCYHSSLYIKKTIEVFIKRKTLIFELAFTDNLTIYEDIGISEILELITSNIFDLKTNKISFYNSYFKQPVNIEDVVCNMLFNSEYQFRIIDEIDLRNPSNIYNYSSDIVYGVRNRIVEEVGRRKNEIMKEFGLIKDDEEEAAKNEKSDLIKNNDNHNSNKDKDININSNSNYLVLNNNIDIVLDKDNKDIKKDEYCENKKNSIEFSEESSIKLNSINSDRKFSNNSDNSKLKDVEYNKDINKDIKPSNTTNIKIYQQVLKLNKIITNIKNSLLDLFPKIKLTHINKKKESIENMKDEDLTYTKFLFLGNKIEKINYSSVYNIFIIDDIVFYLLPYTVENDIEELNENSLSKEFPFLSNRDIVIPNTQLLSLFIQKSYIKINNLIISEYFNIVFDVYSLRNKIKLSKSMTSNKQLTNYNESENNNNKQSINNTDEIQESIDTANNKKLEKKIELMESDIQVHQAQTIIRKLLFNSFSLETLTIDGFFKEKYYLEELINEYLFSNKTITKLIIKDVDLKSLYNNKKKVFENLVNVITNRNITNLSLLNCQINDEMLAMILNGLVFNNNKILETLNLKNNNITNAGFKSLCEFFKLYSNITSFNNSNNDNKNNDNLSNSDSINTNLTKVKQRKSKLLNYNTNINTPTILNSICLLENKLSIKKLFKTTDPDNIYPYTKILISKKIELFDLSDAFLLENFTEEKVEWLFYSIKQYSMSSYYSFSSYLKTYIDFVLCKFFELTRTQIQAYGYLKYKNFYISLVVIDDSLGEKALLELFMFIKMKNLFIEEFDISMLSGCYYRLFFEALIYNKNYKKSLVKVRKRWCSDVRHSTMRKYIRRFIIISDF